MTDQGMDQHTPHGLPKVDRYGFPGEDPRAGRLLQALQDLGYGFASWTQQQRRLVLVVDKALADGDELERPLEVLLGRHRSLFHLHGLEDLRHLAQPCAACGGVAGWPRCWRCRSCRRYLCSDTCAQAHLELLADAPGCRFDP